MTRKRAWLLLICLPLWGQERLQVRVVEGDGVVYTVGSHATRGVTIEVTDGDGKPVEGATVRLELPPTGPSGTFPDGERTAAITTGPDGRVEAWGMQWNRTPGPLDVRITASKGALTSSGRAGLSLTSAPLPVDVAGQSPRHSHKKLWIALVVAGAGGVAILGLAGKSTTAAAAPAAVNAPVIGAPTITIGPQ